MLRGADQTWRRTAGGFSVERNSVLSRRVKRLRGAFSSVEGLPADRLREMMLELCPGLPCQLPVLGERIRCDRSGVN